MSIRKIRGWLGPILVIAIALLYATSFIPNVNWTKAYGQIISPQHGGSSSGGGGGTGGTGAPGATGGTGGVGPSGAAGTAGASGVPGTTGASGAPGTAGAVGGTGGTGGQGATGSPGAVGATGGTGGVGPSGGTGGVGTAGATGVPGSLSSVTATAASTPAVSASAGAVVYSNGIVNTTGNNAGSAEFFITAGAAGFGGSPLNQAVSVGIAGNNCHFINLTCTCTFAASCTTKPAINVFDGSNVGTPVTCVNTTQSGHTTVGASSTETLAIAAGDVYGIYISTAGASCTTSFFILSAEVVCP